MREIELQRGLNLIVSPPGVGSSGHGAGKTAFCQLLRFVLENPHWSSGSNINELRVSSLAPVGNLGRITIKSKLNDFEVILAEIKKDLDKCRIETQNLIEGELEKTKLALGADLVRATLKKPPIQFRCMYQLNKADVERYEIKELAKVFPHADKLVEGMNISCIYKDVTYDMLKNEVFTSKLNDIIPESILDGALLRENTAAAGDNN